MINETNNNSTNYKLWEDGEPFYYHIKYDLGSMMQYNGKNGTMISLDPRRAFLMGQRKMLSFMDQQMAVKAYNCTGESII